METEACAGRLDKNEDKSGAPSPSLGVLCGFRGPIKYKLQTSYS
uniref:Uncharacterized protein n=1 Tax=Arundo donax TaxID=35708 RepID=A0A0A9B9T2_ARUDO